MPSRAPIVTRQTTSGINTENLNKGSSLTFEELDKNFIGLRDQTIGIVGDDSTGIDVKAGDTVTIAGTQNITTAVTGDTVTITGPDLTSYITASSSDTLTNKTISGSSNTLSNIANSSLTHSQISFVGDDSTGTAVSLGETIKFAGSGGATVAVSGDTVTITAGGAGGGGDIGNLQVNDTTLSPITTNDDLILTANGTGVVGVTSNFVMGDVTETNANIKVTSSVTNLIESYGDSGSTDLLEIRSGSDFSSDDSQVRILAKYLQLNHNVNTFLQATGGAGDFYIQNGVSQGTPSGSPHNYILLTDTNDGEIVISPKTGKWVEIQGLKYPTSDGTTGQVLTTNGAGVLSWSSGAGIPYEYTTFVGDDSTGTQVNLGETFKIAGANGVTTAVSGDTLTVTGSGSQLTFVGDDSTGTTVSLNETFKIAGAGTVTTAVSGDTVTITGAGGDVVNDTTPQLGGDLDVNGNDIVSVSNGNIKILPNGTGRAILGTDPTDGSTGFYGNNSVYGAQMNYENTAWNAATGPQYPNPLTRSTDWTLDASTTTSGRIRMLDAVELDLNGYDWNFSADAYSGPQNQNVVVLRNTSSSASNTLENAITNFNKLELDASGSLNSTITLNNAYGVRTQTVANQDSGDTASIGTNYGYHYQSPANFGSGTLNVTNEYGLYLDQSSSTATGTNTGIYINNSGDDAIRIEGTPSHGVYFTGTSSSSYGFRCDSNAPNNRLGGIQFQFNRAKFPGFASTPSTVSTLAWIYARGTGPSGQAEMYVMDGQGNETQISPHNDQGEWEYFSRNTKTGKTVRVNMEKMIRKLEEITGETFIENE